jgi:hypothetical protein
MSAIHTMVDEVAARKTKKQKGPVRRAIGYGAILLVVMLVSVTAAPQLLAWPHQSKVGSTFIYSVKPIPPETASVLQRTDRLLAQSPLRETLGERTIFLTDGGWRWNLLALASRGAFALRRPFRDSVIVNRSDVAADRIERGAEVAGVRSLSGTLAHEFTHILVARRYGEMRAATLPQNKSEGLADFVAQESSLSEGDYRRLRSSGETHPALAYYEGRRQVAETLRRNKGDLDRLFFDN